MGNRLRLTTLEPTHGQALHAVLAFLLRDPRVAWVHQFNTGAHVVEGVNAIGRPARRFIRYAFKGCSDILGQLMDGRFLAVEIKVKRDTLSPEQQAFLLSVNDAGGLAFVAHSIEDARAALDMDASTRATLGQKTQP